MQIYSLCSPIVIKKLFFTLKLFFLALIFRLLTYSKGQQSFEASKTIDSSNLSARSTKSNSFWSSWIRFYKSKAITFISCKIYTSIKYKSYRTIFLFWWWVGFLSAYPLVWMGHSYYLQTFQFFPWHSGGGLWIRVG